MPTVVRWSGREIRALRQAKRMSLRMFADHLGVSERMVSKWEAGGQTISPRPANQAALDTSLARSESDVQERFAVLVTVDAARGPDQQAGSLLAPADEHHTRHPGDGRLMAHIPEGIFLSGAGKEPIWLPGYWIDVYPTTNADYSRFVAATGHREPRHWANGRCPERLLDHPVTWVTWHDATAYATWAGKALATSHQWEKAARGPNGDTYPWGTARTTAKCNTRESGIRATAPVDRYHSGVSPYGVYDLCGNTWEWIGTETTPGRYQLKGSAFTSPFSQAEPSAFNDASTDMADDDTSFRCVATSMVGFP